MTTLAPICLFVFNRLEHTKKTVEHLLKNKEAADSDLIVFSDGPRKPQEELQVQEVRKYIQEIQGFKSVRIVTREKNFGLAKSIIEGVTQIVNEYGMVIVLEDDLVSSPFFLEYMNQGLKVYAKEPKVASIHAYIYPIEVGPEETFFLKGADCWGWATWKDKWAYFESDGQKLLNELKRKKLTSQFDFDGSYPYTRMLKNQIAGKNNSWAIRWYASAFVNDLYTLYPKQSLVANIGFDSSGTHCNTTDQFDVALLQNPISVQPLPVIDNQIKRNEVIRYFEKIDPPLRSRIYRKLKTWTKICVLSN